MIIRKEAHMKHSKTGFFTITILFAGLFFTLSVISAHCGWASTYGGAGKDYLEAIQQTSDGGYIVAGFTYSFGSGDADAWVLKLDSTGTVAWQKTHGGAGNEYARSIQQTADGGYIVAGNTYSFGAGDADAWVLKLDSTGTVAWQKTYGGLVTDYAVSIQHTADGGNIIAGTSDSFGTGTRDFWVMKLNSAGTVDCRRRR